DCAQLARMNKQLIVAEGSDNPMDEAALTARMHGFLHGSYRAWFFVSAADIVGYTLVDTARTPYYVRHFFVVASMRRQGLGRQAFALLKAQLDHQPIELEVLVSNPAGLAFWQALGLVPRSICLRG
ncbi:MAG: N-acetyltransferase family protein, partial [Roseiflexaceae bacterium]